jgi:hypothetical protein
MLQPESLVKQLDKDSPNSSFKGDWGPGPLPLGAPPVHPSATFVDPWGSRRQESLQWVKNCMAPASQPGAQRAAVGRAELVVGWALPGRNQSSSDKPPQSCTGG